MKPFGQQPLVAQKPFAETTWDILALAQTLIL
jgi:hypothetical protein